MNAHEHIAAFIAAQTVATVCCTNADQQLHCFSCYYAFDAGQTLLYFKTSADTQHMQWLQAMPQTAGSILPDKLQKLVVKGIQWSGVLLAEDDPLAAHAGKQYHLKYPFALAMPGTVRTIRLDTIKMTDNSLGFGSKVHWKRES